MEGGEQTLLLLLLMLLFLLLFLLLLLLFLLFLLLLLKVRGLRSADRLQHFPRQTAENHPVRGEESDGKQPGDFLLHPLPPHVRHRGSQLCLDLWHHGSGQE